MTLPYQTHLMFFFRPAVEKPMERRHRYYVYKGKTLSRTVPSTAKSRNPRNVSLSTHSPLNPMKISRNAFFVRRLKNQWKEGIDIMYIKEKPCHVINCVAEAYRKEQSLRKSKLSIRDTIQLIIGAEGGSLAKELHRNYYVLLTSYPYLYF